MTSPDQPDRVEHRMERTYEVAATPEHVWDAIATADGISAWMVPTRLDPQIGGAVSFDVGAFWSHGIVTDYTPTSRFAYAEPWPTTDHDLSSVTPIATEFLIESASGGKCVIRVVTSAYGSGADWENEFFAEMIADVDPNARQPRHVFQRGGVAMGHADATLDGVQSTQPSTRRLVRSGALAGAIAAVCTTVVAAVARAAGVSLEVDGTAIPIPAFVWWTLVGAAVGVVLARLLGERRRFVVVTTVAVGLSLIPAIAAPDDTATKAVLVGTHLLAAAIIIPTLSQRLTGQR